MRLLHVAAVAALAAIAYSDAAVTDPKSSKFSSADQAALADGNNGQFLRKHNEERDSEDSEERGVMVKAKFSTYYKASMTPKQVARAIGLSLGSQKQRKELQRFYLGYYSYYTAKKRRDHKKKELEGYVYS
ncbi:hypothetical protein PF005_g24636 [Phytophthora fragariae]|uniref:RxLR effector protein n=1 Tax=Phytophthora fragariae TaxID=53985 RepID=A0A6A3W0V2_9STRA|nr:hypothetical protein PF003_g23509 [Phytophthora fragariae]KAE8923292.1 hypothetical protein PF009_g26456 [Phytophthora fragariae]KAE8977741.1 hypothetical protein PF011_g23527 [Phytophthora fragariae]KAE9072868.1 hypothetical protein PF010_g25311 [Phytophthora fragariae]KAE9074642.1 hypothetical protein PF007_g25326 [Phytophthora fragariae]